MNVSHKESGPYIKLQFRKDGLFLYTQESGQLTFSIKLAPDKGPWNSGGVRFGPVVAM